MTRAIHTPIRTHAALGYVLENGQVEGVDIGSCVSDHTHTHTAHCGFPSRLDRKLDPAVLFWLLPLTPEPPKGSIWLSSD